jgi:hypothetical protein
MQQTTILPIELRTVREENLLFAILNAVRTETEFE